MRKNQSLFAVLLIASTSVLLLSFTRQTNTSEKIKSPTQNKLMPPPTAPTGITATDLAVGDFCHYATTRYTATGATGATSYNWYVSSTGSPGSFTSISSLPNGTALIAGDSSCDMFYIGVEAVNSSGSSSMYVDVAYKCTPYDVCAPLKTVQKIQK